MDIFKKGMEARCGVRGLKCRCCNDFGGSGKQKAILRRIVRRTLKLKDNNE